MVATVRLFHPRPEVLPIREAEVAVERLCGGCNNAATRVHGAAPDLLLCRPAFLPVGVAGITIERLGRGLMVRTGASMVHTAPKLLPVGPALHPVRVAGIAVKQPAADF